MQHSYSMNEIVHKINALVHAEEEDPVKCVIRLQERMTEDNAEFEKTKDELEKKIEQ